jgi:ribosomal protein L11 methyltransferase
MKYYEVKFNISPFSTDAADIVAALAGEAGFETFEQSDDSLTGYVQQQLFDEDVLQTMLQGFPLPGISISYTVTEAEDRDWNETWEQQGFEPIVVSLGGDEANDSVLIIHDGRHLPQDISLTSLNTQPSAIAIEIDARQAFGTGTHETTRMMCRALMALDLQQKQVLDCGTGTGILAIAALKLGARAAVGYDIDEWSVDNARHNAVINSVDDQFTSLQGDATILNKVAGPFDVVMANINRNILLADLPTFAGKMSPGATLLLSGFYQEDIPMLVERAETTGLHLERQYSDNHWACLQLLKS